jgi:sugar/nucleoside kinase (ribokinase family)
MRCMAPSLWRSPREQLNPGAALAATVAGLKCNRMGGFVRLPTRAEVEAFIAERDGQAARRFALI